MSQEEPHVTQMRGISGEIILERLLVADVNKEIPEESHMGIIIDSGQQTTLHHILHDSHSLQTHRFTSGIRTGDYQNPFVMGKVDTKRNHLASMLT